MSLVLIVHNVRSAHNVGSLLRTADGLGVEQVILSGYTPYPHTPGDGRLAHEARRVHERIHKTALGAEQSVVWSHADDITEAIEKFRARGHRVFALEQAPNAISLPLFKPPAKMALIVGREVEGIEPEILARCDGVLEIPMQGQKESFNVAVAAAIAMYHLLYLT